MTMHCPNCDAGVSGTDTGIKIECEDCGTEVRQIIAKEADLLSEVADSDSPAAELAQAALEIEGYR